MLSGHGGTPCDPRPRGAEVEGLPCVQGQPGPHHYSLNVLLVDEASESVDPAGQEMTGLWYLVALCHPRAKLSVSFAGFDFHFDGCLHT